jgi:hypothetical protein
MQPHFRVLMLCSVPIVVALVLLFVYVFSVVAMWRLWVMHQEYYDEDNQACCRLREREFPENIVVLIRRRLLTFYSFLLCFFFPAFLTNGLRGSVLPCLSVAGSKDYHVDPLAGHPSMNQWFRFQCNAKGEEGNAFWLTLFTSLAILCLYCFFVPFAGIAWLICNRHHIVDYHVEQFLGDGNVLQLPSVRVKTQPGSVLALKYMFEHFERVRNFS